MAKVSASEMDAIILTIPRLTVRQLDRLAELVNKEKMWKLDNRKYVALEVMGEKEDPS